MSDLGSSSTAQSETFVDIVAFIVSFGVACFSKYSVVAVRRVHARCCFSNERYADKCVNKSSVTEVERELMFVFIVILMTILD